MHQEKTGAHKGTVFQQPKLPLGRCHKLDCSRLKDRLTTFPSWNPQLMAEAGFVYGGQGDLVYCFSCNIKLDGWTEHMDPLLRHKEESPTCSFVIQQLQTIKAEKRRVKSVVAPSKPLNPQQTASIRQLQSQTSSLVTSKPIHTVVTGLDEPRSSYTDDNFSLVCLPITVGNYESIEERIRSFVGWPLEHLVSAEQLARVGFVYTGEGSLVQCFQCGVRYRNWLKGDMPLSVHQKCNPRCAFLHTLTCKSKLVKDQRLNKLILQPEGISCTVPNESVTLEFPDYTNQATRLQSFKYWGGVLPKEELAEAGFYMIARRDVVRCFSCHVVLQDWERTDNVIEEHQRHRPNCEFLKKHLSHMKVSHHVDKTFSIKTSKDSASDSDNSETHYPPSWLYTHLSLPPPQEDSNCEESVLSDDQVYDMLTSLQLANTASEIEEIVVSLCA